MNNNHPIPDALTGAPEAHRLLFENEHVRVLDVMTPVGMKTGMHSHPENVSYVIVGGKLKFSYPDGTSKEIEIAPGQVTAPGPGSHIVENIGTTEVHVIQVELKK